jgi:YebC/PmpR family DNA-binding regulatory protein
MSGHSKWATIKRAKGKADAARGRVFSRLIREITIAARIGGGNADANPRLRSAVSTARAANMPKNNIENAILKGTGQLEGVTFEEFVLEGYAPGGVALLVECMSDNRNRTISEVRHVITKAGGSLGAANSVNWMFKTKGIFSIPKKAMDEDSMMELVLEAGADDLRSDGDEYEVATSPEAFEAVRAALEKTGVQPSHAELTKLADTAVKVEGETAQKVLKLLDALDELDDTQHVYSNFEAGEEDLARYNEEK